VFAPVQNGPVDLSRVPLGQERRLTFSIQELEDLQKEVYRSMTSLILRPDVTFIKFSNDHNYK